MSEDLTEVTARPWPPERYPTDDELGAWLGVCTPEERKEHAGRYLLHAQRAVTCFEQDHAARRESDAETIRGLREALERLLADVEALASEWEAGHRPIHWRGFCADLRRRVGTAVAADSERHYRPGDRAGVVFRDGKRHPATLSDGFVWVADRDPALTLAAEGGFDALPLSEGEAVECCERDAYRKAKQENDERFQVAASKWRERYERLRGDVEALAAKWKRPGLLDDPDENVHDDLRAVLDRHETSEGVGTGAGEGAPRQDTGSAWVTRSADCPEAPAQAHPLARHERPEGEAVDLSRDSRGFKRGEPIPSEYGGQVTTHESSAAEHPHIWVRVEAPVNLNEPHGETHEAPAHLTIENARRLRDQLTALIEGHYHLVTRKPEAGEQR